MLGHLIFSKNSIVTHPLNLVSSELWLNLHTHYHFHKSTQKNNRKLELVHLFFIFSYLLLPPPHCVLLPWGDCENWKKIAVVVKALTVTQDFVLASVKKKPMLGLCIFQVFHFCTGIKWRTALPFTPSGGIPMTLFPLDDVLWKFFLRYCSMKLLSLPTTKHILVLL